MYQARAWLAIAVTSLLLTAVVAGSIGCSSTCPCKKPIVFTSPPASASKRDPAKTTGAASRGPAASRKPEAKAAPAVDQSVRAVEELAVSVRKHAQKALGDSVEIKSAWKPVDAIGWSGRQGAKTLALSFKATDSDKPLAVYYLVAWQPLFGPDRDRAATALSVPLLTVTGRALVFGYPASVGESEGGTGAGSGGEGGQATLGADLQGAVAEALELEKNQRRISGEVKQALPEALKLISLKIYPHYAVVQAALPGSGMAQPGELSRAFPARMLHLSLVPDQGPVIRHWIAPESNPPPGSGTCPCNRQPR